MKDLATELPEAFRAFADTTRLRLLNLLLERELCVCDLVTVLDCIQPKISRHLAYLRRTGFVRVRRRGRWRHYSIQPDPDALHAQLLACIRSTLRRLPPLDADLQRLNSQAAGGCCE